jgi:hypothetical protein
MKSNHEETKNTKKEKRRKKREERKERTFVFFVSSWLLYPIVASRRGKRCNA